MVNSVLMRLHSYWAKIFLWINAFLWHGNAGRVCEVGKTLFPKERKGGWASSMLFGKDKLRRGCEVVSLHQMLVGYGNVYAQSKMC